MYRRSFWLWLVILACVLLPASPAVGGDDLEQQAKELLDRGVELMEQGSFEQAETAISRSYELNPSAAALYRLAEVFAALDRPLESLEALEQYERDVGGGLDAKARAAVAALLARVRGQVGRLAIVVEPEGASVFVDGDAVGRAPLDSEVRVTAGKHHVSAQLEGYVQKLATVAAAGGQRTTVKIVLQPDQQVRSGAGQLLIQCDVPAVAVAVGGKPIGKTPFFGPLGVPRGQHELSFERPGYEMPAKQVEVAGEEPAAVSCDAKMVRPIEASIAGTVVLKLSEQDVEVEVDGHPWPADGRLPAGPHVMTVRGAGSSPVKVDFVLKAGEQKTLPINLASMRGGDAGYSTDTGPSAGRVLAWVAAAAGLAAGGTAFGLFMWNDGRKDDWETEQAAIDQARADGTPASALAARQSANDELEDGVSTIDTLAIGLGIGGGALLLTGIILFITTGSSDGEDDALLLAPVPGGGLAGWSTTW
ncbi:MAG: PEGA domain-containing protein [Deltaproteobacteria bacterium]|jgi:hypothetical protein|nr:PEGA domain-containing protein [Deltaproteobacteria bacterium]MBW2530588.1 PEGA domain-containing protein [Deltaproteobacteria bacterium]